MLRSRREFEQDAQGREQDPAAVAEARAPGDLASLARAPAELRAQALMRSGGNAAVARALATEPPAPGGAGAAHTEVTRHRFTAEIRRDAAAPKPDAGPVAAAVASAMQDAGPGHEHTGGAAEAAAAVGVPASPEAPAVTAAPAPAAATAAAPAAEGSAPAGPAAAGPDEGKEIRLPEIKLAGAEDFALCDPVFSWLGYTGTISRGGATPGGFGVTRPGNMTLKNIGVRTFLSRFVVTATLEQELKWQVRSGTGPSGQVSIGSINDGNITKANYPDVVKDLTPDTTDLNGRPPRANFWAEDLTEQHEKFHADDAKGRAPAAIGIASRWLDTQVAADVPGVQTLLGEVPGRAFTALMASMAMPAREERAYGDGAGAYSRRATGVSALGAVGWYS